MPSITFYHPAYTEYGIVVIRVYIEVEIKHIRVAFGKKTRCDKAVVDPAVAR